MPEPGEPLFLPDDTEGALELAADDDARCPRGHYLDEGGEVHVTPITCNGCAAEDSSRRAAHRDVELAGPDAVDLLDGRYFTARIDYQEA